MDADLGHTDLRFCVGLDLAQGGSDYTALAVLQRTTPLIGVRPDYTLIWLERWRDRRTARIPERLHAVWRQLRMVYGERVFAATGTMPTDPLDIQLAVDITGVGPFATDPLRVAGFTPTEITIHGGDAVSHPSAHAYRVPKRDLAGAVHTLLETQRIRFAASLADADNLRAELENFRAKITLSGHDRYEAGGGDGWRVGAHDDLVLAIAIAAWLSESHPTPTLDPLIMAAWTDLPRG